MSDPLRQLESHSLAEFVASCALLFRGRVLDFGCGKQPYRFIVEGGGAKYVGFDAPGFPASVAEAETGPLDWARVTWDAILCTQVVQYVPDVAFLLETFWDALSPDGHLILTGPTNWPVVEREDLWRFTPAGISQLLHHNRFTVERLVERAHVPSPGGPMLIGWGIVATP